MNPLGEQVLLVAKEYLGPAAQQFLSKELRALECTADTITPWHLPALSERAHIAAGRIMDGERAGEFGDRVAGLAASPRSVTPRATHRKEGGAPRLALDAAAKLQANGRLRQAEEAYRQLAQKYGDGESFRGLALTQVVLEDIPAALLALRDGAASLACKAAIKINMRLTHEKMRWLIDRLLITTSPTTCPHGRPIILRLSMKDIERGFHRT